jgi:hypothetical protein
MSAGAESIIYPHYQNGLSTSAISVVENISLHLAFSRLTQKAAGARSYQQYSN